MSLKKYITNKRTLIFSAAAFVYAFLWLLTGILGAPQVKKEVMWNYIQANGKVTHRHPGSEDWCYVKTYAPFIVRADYGFGGTLSGIGGDQLYFWAFGRTYKIGDVSFWVS